MSAMKVTTWLLTPIMQNADGGAEPTLLAATHSMLSRAPITGRAEFAVCAAIRLRRRQPLCPLQRCWANLFTELERITGITYAI
jgi:hypothetical protein